MPEVKVWVAAAFLTDRTVWEFVKACAMHEESGRFGDTHLNSSAVEGMERGMDVWVKLQIQNGQPCGRGLLPECRAENNQWTFPKAVIAVFHSWRSVLSCYCVALQTSSLHQTFIKHGQTARTSMGLLPIKRSVQLRSVRRERKRKITSWKHNV